MCYFKQGQHSTCANTVAPPHLCYGGKWRCAEVKKMTENNLQHGESPRNVMHNFGLTGKEFASWHGMIAIHIDAYNVSDSFRILCESAPHRAYDHIVYGRRSDGQYIGIGQPYPMAGDTLCEVNAYCHTIGFEMIVTGHSTWAPDCMRILFQRDDNNLERFNIAINCARWRSSIDGELLLGGTNTVIAEVNRRFEAITDGKSDD